MSSLCRGSQSFRCMSMFVPIQALFSMDRLDMPGVVQVSKRYQANECNTVCMV